MNNKGFMMAEVIVVSAVILVTLVGLYTSYNKIFTVYNQRIDYYDVDTLYKLANIRDNSWYPDNIGERTKIGNKIVLYVDKNSIKNMSIDTKDLNQTFVDYLNYLSTALDFDNLKVGNYEIQNMLIMENCVDENKNSCKYAYLEVVDENSCKSEYLKVVDEVNTYVEPILNGAVPILEEGMIPVTISDNGAVITADTSQQWYSYTNKQWANAVLVNNTVRSTYINSNGTINANLSINESDILAYYVWIPRYKYTFPKNDGNPETISIVFENSCTTKSVPTSGSASGTEYYTHPAFTFGTRELNGIWVGKFETTGDATTATIKPNLTSLRNQNVSTQFITSLKFAGGTLSNGIVSFAGSSTYGLTSSTDSHMMKNREFGVVSYLSHSRYGKNSEIRINNNNGFITGCGASVENATSTSECQIAYGSGVTSYPQSTTGNITGIFDMSGGAYEFTMGVYSDSNGNPMSGKSSDENSGFNGLLFDGTTYSSVISFPENKYYDLYLSSHFNGDYSTNMVKCTLATCGGHALHETANWYGDYDDFLQSADPWWRRGGDCDDGSLAGAFYANDKYGQSGNTYSWRSVIVSGRA